MFHGLAGDPTYAVQQRQHLYSAACRLFNTGSGVDFDAFDLYGPEKVKLLDKGSAANSGSLTMCSSAVMALAHNRF
jgi:hypothetical protein